MSTYVLIHGAWHGAWCWDKIVPLLKKKGHKVEATDLPGHGKDKTPIAQVTLKAYVDRVCQILDAQPKTVILVGHSMGGLVITQAAEYRPEKIKTLVLLAAYFPRNGEALAALGSSDKDPAKYLLANMIMSEDHSYFTVKDEVIKEIFYGDCSDKDVARAKSLWVPQPAAPLFTPVNTTEEKFGGVRRIYISTLRDKCIHPAMQEYMYKAQPCEKVISMDTSHSPFLSHPEELVRNLLSF